MMFVAGIMMFSSLVMMPQFLQLLMGYSSESAGLVLSGGGILLLFMMPIAGILTSKVQARYLIATGWLLTCAAMYYSAQHLDLEHQLLGCEPAAGGSESPACRSSLCRSSLVSYVGLPAAKSNDIAGLVSFMRNIGSSIGTSMVTTLLARSHSFIRCIWSRTRHLASRRSPPWCRV